MARMCEPLVPIDELRRLDFALASLASLVGRDGSHERENARNVADGIRARLKWVIANLNKAGEGQKNFGLSMFREDA
jgi:hypothetical protein